MGTCPGPNGYMRDCQTRPKWVHARLSNQAQMGTVIRSTDQTANKIPEPRFLSRPFECAVGATLRPGKRFAPKPPRRARSRERTREQTRKPGARTGHRSHPEASPPAEVTGKQARAGCGARGPDSTD